MSLVDAIPQSIREVGRINASRAGASGAYGQLVGEIGQSISTIPAQIQAKKIQQQQEQARAQELQIQQGQLADQTRKRAAEDALNNALSNPDVLTPEGDVNMAALGSHLRGTPAMTQFPELVQHWTQMKEAGARLHEQTIKNAGDEADYLGSLAAGSDALKDPTDKAAALLAGVSSAVKKGILTPEAAHPIIAGLMGDDGNPDPLKVASTIQQMRQASTEQRKLDDEHQRTNARAQADIARAEAEGQKAATETADKRLKNVSAQLGAATSKTGYAMVYRGVPDDLKSRFDAPEAFDPKSSPQRARFAGMSAKEQQDAIHDIAQERLEQARESRLASGVQKDATYDRDFAQYKLYLGQWTDQEKAKPGPLDENGNPQYDEMGKPVKTAYEMPPTFDEWKTSLEKGSRPRATLAAGDIHLPPSSGSAPATAAPATNAGAGTVTLDEVRRMAKRLGISEDESRRRAIEAGLAVVK